MSTDETPRLQTRYKSRCFVYFRSLNDVGPGRTALAAVASEPAAVDAVFPAPARSRSARDALASLRFLQPFRQRVLSFSYCCILK